MAFLRGNNGIIKKHHKKIWFFEPAALPIYLAKVFLRATFLPSESRVIPCELCVKAAQWEVPTSRWAMNCFFILHKLSHMGHPQLPLQLQASLLLPPWPCWGRLALVPNLLQLSPKAAAGDLPVGLKARLQCSVLRQWAVNPEENGWEPQGWFGVSWPTEEQDSPNRAKGIVGDRRDFSLSSTLGEPYSRSPSGRVRE